MTTTVRVSVDDFRWVKTKKVEFSALLRSKIHELQKAEDDQVVLDYIAELRRTHPDTRPAQLLEAKS